jgi:hypothetical protein
MSVQDAIRVAEALLPGEPAPEGEKDPRWQAIIAVADFVPTEPEAVWEFVRAWGSHPQEDLRDAIACCLLEHLLEYHCATIFPLVEKLALKDPLFGDMFLRCWKFGQSDEPANAERFDALRQRLGEGPSFFPPTLG